MYAEKNTETDSTACLDSGYAVTSVVPLEDFRLYVTFVDGTAGEVQMRGLIFGRNPGVFSILAEPSIFSQVFVDPDTKTVTWPGELDLAPDTMHDEIWAAGVDVIDDETWNRTYSEAPDEREARLVETRAARLAPLR